MIYNSRMGIFFRTIFFLSTFLFLSNCYYSSGNSGTSPSGFISFETDVLSVFDEKCATSGCHVGVSPGGGLNLAQADSDVTTVYDDTLEEIELGDPESSLLLTKASNTVSHTGGEVLSTSSDDYQLILAWIVAGAFNDSCDGVSHSFSADVVPIFSQCTAVGCHDVTAPVLTSSQYENIQDANALDLADPTNSSLLRKPLGMDSHTGGAVFDDMSDTDYKTIFCWIKVDDAADN